MELVVRAYQSIKGMSPKTRRHLARSLGLAVSLVGIALFVGAFVWVLTGSRTQAIQSGLMILMVELVVVSLVGALVCVLALVEGE